MARSGGGMTKGRSDGGVRARKKEEKEDHLKNTDPGGRTTRKKIKDKKRRKNTGGPRKQRNLVR